MSLLTLDQTITFSMNQMGESQNTPGGGDTIAYQTLVLEAADEVAQDTNCFSGNVTFDFVANQSVYSTPASVYQIIGAYCTGNDLFIYKLLSSQQEEMDDRYPGWRNLVSGTVTYLIDKGTNQLELYPPPTTSSLVFSYTDLVVSASSQYQVSSAGQRTFVSSDAVQYRPLQYTVRQRRRSDRGPADRHGGVNRRRRGNHDGWYPARRLPATVADVDAQSSVPPACPGTGLHQVAGVRKAYSPIPFAG